MEHHSPDYLQGRADTFRALKATIVMLSERYGVTIEDQEYPCLMLSQLVEAVSNRPRYPISDILNRYCE